MSGELRIPYLPGMSKTDCSGTVHTNGSRLRHLGNGSFLYPEVIFQDLPSFGSPSTSGRTAIPLFDYSIMLELERSLPMPKTQRLSKQVEVQHLVGDHVVIDNEIKAIVVSIEVRLVGNSYRLNWWHNGAVQEGWFDEWRVTADEE
jgi:hypothetical protein